MRFTLVQVLVSYCHIIRHCQSATIVGNDEYTRVFINMCSDLMATEPPQDLQSCIEQTLQIITQAQKVEKSAFSRLRDIYALLNIGRNAVLLALAHLDRMLSTQLEAGGSYSGNFQPCRPSSAGCTYGRSPKTTSYSFRETPHRIKSTVVAKQKVLFIAAWVNEEDVTACNGGLLACLRNEVEKEGL